MGTISERRRPRPRRTPVVEFFHDDDDSELPKIPITANISYSTGSLRPDSTSNDDNANRPRRRRKKKGTAHRYLRKLLNNGGSCGSLQTREFFDNVAILPQTLLCWVLGILLTCGVMIRTFVFHPPTSFRAKFSQSYSAIQRNMLLYKQMYDIATEGQLPSDQTKWPQHVRHPFELTSTYRETVDSCSLTIVVMEAKLGYPSYDYGPGQLLWFSLESIGAFAPEDSCVVLLTSDCAMKEYLGSEGKDEAALQKAIINGVYEQSLPLFRRKIESGRVRISYVDHKKYHIRNCKEFSSSNNALFHRFFWEDEFEERDSDLVMVFQAEESVLCYPLLTKHMTDYAFVGSVWNKVSNPFEPDSLEGPCREMPKLWHSWLRPQRRDRQKMQSDGVGSATAGKTRSLLREDFPAVCEGNRAPIGSGGLSLRSRKWMIRAIETCPHVIFSGVDLESDEQFIHCKVFDPIKEDYYFATILQGIDAPLPSAYVATLFSAEAFWPEQVLEVYPATSSLDGALTGSDLSIPNGRPTISSLDGETEMVIPNGIHNVWWYHPEEMLRSDVMADVCPFLPFMYTPSMNRYEEYTQERETWIGIGK